MTTQRIYSLPNCKLVVEGFTSESESETVLGRPLMSIVTNVECHFLEREQPLTGGREFLESLAAAVSGYAQEYLSGIARVGDRHAAHAVQIHAIDKNHHRLLVQPQAADQTLSFPAPTQIDLNTVQLFDLVEAIDQFYADTQTLPEVSLKLTSLPRRQAVTQREPVAKQALPAAVGVSGLAVAALAFFLVPVPKEVRRPQPSSSTPQESPLAASSSSPSGSPSGSPSSSPGSASNNASGSASPSAAVAASSPNTSPSSSPSANGSPSPAAGATAVSPGATAAADTLFRTAPEISDPAQLEQLTTGLYNKLDQGWKKAPTFSEPLVYRVGVSQTGEILGFKFANDAALNYLNEVPLAEVQFNPNASPQQSIAQFKVVFKPNGVLEVSPWYGRSDSPSSP